MRSVTRYILSLPAADEPVVPLAPLLPTTAEPAPAPLGRGIASTDTTTAFGVPAEIPAASDGIPAAPCACDDLPMLPAPLVAALPPPCALPLMLPLALLPEPLEPLSMLPLDPLDPLVPMLPLPMLPLESLAPLEPLVPLEPLASLLPLVPLEPLLPLPMAPDSSPPPRMELHPVSASASKPASTTLCCFRFMINSLCCLICSGCA